MNGKTFTINDIQHLRNLSGVYMLYDGNELVYIGVSRNVYQRILEHCTENKKIFSSIKAITNSNYLLVELLEVLLISKNKTRYNKLRVDNFFSFYNSIPSTLNENAPAYNEVIEILNVPITKLDKMELI